MSTAKTKTKKIELWTCPKCKRKFERHGQSHSCRPYPLAQHFEGKPIGKVLYDKLKRAIRAELGNFKVESLECCIHFVSTYTFAAVKIHREKIMVDFSLSRKINSKRFTQATPISMSAHRYLYCVDIMSEEDIDQEVMEWILEAHDMKRQKASAA